MLLSIESPSPPPKICTTIRPTSVLYSPTFTTIRRLNSSIRSVTPTNGDFMTYNPSSKYPFLRYYARWILTNRKSKTVWKRRRVQCAPIISAWSRAPDKIHKIEERRLCPELQKEHYWTLRCTKTCKIAPTIHLAKAEFLENVNARYVMSTTVLKIFTFWASRKSVSMDNDVLWTLPKRLPFTMLRNTDRYTLTPNSSNISVSTNSSCRWTDVRYPL